MVAKYGNLKVGDLVSLNWSSRVNGLWIVESIYDDHVVLLVAVPHEELGVLKRLKRWRSIDRIEAYYRIIEV